MDLRHLRYFVAVAESGTVSKAADKVRISQPALSRQIHDLESELGVALFERAGRRLHLTGAGEDLLAHGRRVLNEAEAFRERARVLHRGDTGVLHVGATPHSLQRLFPAVLNRFRRVLPGVDIRLTEGHSAMLLDLIRTGALHLAFTTYQPELRKASRLVGVVPLLAISHSERRGQWNTIEVRALEDIPLLLLQRGFGTRELFEAACHVAHIRPNIFLESDAPDTAVIGEGRLWYRHSSRYRKAPGKRPYNSEDRPRRCAVGIPSCGALGSAAFSPTLCGAFRGGAISVRSERIRDRRRIR